MAGIAKQDFSEVSPWEYQKFGQVFPVSMDPVILRRLDECAQRALLSPIFSEKKTLTDVRCVLFDYMERRGFCESFLQSFADLVPIIEKAVEDRSALDDLKQYDVAGIYAKLLAGPAIA